MIRINLLPTDGAGKRAKAKKKSSGALTPYVAGLLLMYAGIAFLGWNIYNKALNSKNTLQKHKDEAARLEKEIAKREKEFYAQNAEAQEVQEKFNVVQALNPPDRLFWSEKLNQLAQAQTKAAVYLTKIMVDERVEEQETQESIERRKAWEAKPKKPGSTEQPPKVIKMPVIWQTLTVEAIAYGTDTSQRLQQVTLFMEALKNQAWERKSGEKTHFMTGMYPDFEVLHQKVDRVGDVDVLQFGFKLRAREQMAKQKTTTPAPPAPGTPAS